MLMQKIFFTADTHFGHENVIRFDNRPFASVEEMDAEMIRRWNNKIGKGDLVYVLGDMIWKSLTNCAEPLIKSLNGQIILIKGNHDGHSNQWYRDCGFDEVYDHSILIQDFYILSHAPLSVMPNYPFVNIFGHIHNNGELPDLGKNFYNDTHSVSYYLFILIVVIIIV